MAFPTPKLMSVLAGRGQSRQTAGPCETVAAGWSLTLDLDSQPVAR